MKARGNTKFIIEMVGKIQALVGEAKSLHYADTNPDGFYIAQKKLEEAHELCIEIRNLYDPI